ncbi:MAG: hypothetical protein U0939_08710 [Pirellulales bacterium]
MAHANRSSPPVAFPDRSGSGVGRVARTVRLGLAAIVALWATSLLAQRSVQAGCGDYLWMNGRPVVWYTPHGAKQSTALAGQTRTSQAMAGQVRFELDEDPSVPRPDGPCRGPHCRGQRPTTPASTPPLRIHVRSIEHVLMAESSAATSPDCTRRLCRDESLPARSALRSRVERPPRA